MRMHEEYYLNIIAHESAVYSLYSRFTFSDNVDKNVIQSQMNDYSRLGLFICFYSYRRIDDSSILFIISLFFASFEWELFFCPFSANILDKMI